MCEPSQLHLGKHVLHLEELLPQRNSDFKLLPALTLTLSHPTEDRALEFYMSNLVCQCG